MKILLEKLGLTRDSGVWLWSQLTSIALLIGSGVVDPAYFGIPPKYWHAAQLFALVVLWQSGKYDSSPLKGKQ